MLIIHETDYHGCGVVYYNGTQLPMTMKWEIFVGL